jgi:putative inorganic carbon (hco3(-)) transporter
VIGLARIAGPIACIGLALLLTARTRQSRIAGLVYAGIGAVLLVASLKVPKPLELAAAVVLLPAVGIGLAWVFRRNPWLVAYLALATIPIRIQFLGHQLLVPLYVVAAGAGISLLWDLLRGDERSRELGRATKPLALYLVFLGLSMLWTSDVKTGAIDLVAFYIPLTIVALSVARLPWEPLKVKILYWELAAMALVFSAVGLYEYETRHIFQNIKLNVGNAYSSFFRVNSVFYDPSIYGRFLVVALLPTAAFLVRARPVRERVAALAFAVVVFLGLMVSFSQSSFAALFVAVLCLAAVLVRVRKIVVIAAAVLVVIALGVAAPKIQHTLCKHHASAVDSVSSGRGSLVCNGLRLAKRHPIYGVGLGSFSTSYSRLTHRSVKHSASHNTPTTVAAEGGVIGLVLFAWLLLSFGLSALRRVDGTLAGDLALSALLVLVALFVHSNAYNDFFEDPTTWLVFGLIGLVATRSRSAMMEPS